MVNERFIELLAKKLSEEIDESGAAELKYLLANDEECLRQYNFFKTYWVQDQEQYSNGDLMFQKIKARIGVNDAIDEGSHAPSGLRRISLVWRGAAAALLIGICVYAFYYHYALSSNAKELANLEITKTPSRVKSKIILSDGTVITLNSETTLKYPAVFDGKTREVYLSGEAFFDVAKDHKHPFIVHAGKMSVRVLGTAFNVKSYYNDSRSETTLIRGSIEVTLADRPSDRIILKPNEKLILSSTSIEKRLVNSDLMKAAHTDSANTNYVLTNLTYLKPNDTTIVETSWINNKFIFKDEAFNEIANRMERWYGVKIEFKNQHVKGYRFTGVFEKETLTQALDALKMIDVFNYKYKNETVYIY
jgi:transmembrane sensor